MVLTTRAPEFQKKKKNDQHNLEQSEEVKKIQDLDSVIN